jgi:hypothetical protein
MADRQAVAAAFESWLHEIEAHSIPEGVVAVNLGLFETTDGYAAYLTGSRHYDPEDDSWASSEDFVPKTKYFPAGSAFSGMPWSDALASYRRLLESYLADHPRSQLQRLTAITVGFDDGDLERLK